MILATQSSDDLERSQMLSVIVESCATKMFLANPGMDQGAYREIFHLNETEAALISGLVPKQQILIKRPDFSKVVNLNVDPAGYWLYTSNPYDNQRRGKPSNNTASPAAWKYFKGVLHEQTELCFDLDLGRRSASRYCGNAPGPGANR